MSRQIEQDVDPVRPDLLGQPLVADAEHIAPLGRGGLQTASQIVFAGAVGVADGLDLLLAEAFLVEVLQHADQEIADRVPPQIGRNEAQAEPPVAGRIANPRYFRRLRRRRVTQRRRVPAIILGMGFGQFGQRHRGAILERQEQVAVALGIVRLEFQRPAVAGDRFVQLPLVVQRAPRLLQPRHNLVSTPAPGGSRRPLPPASPAPLPRRPG